MRKSLMMIAGVFLFVLVFSFFGVQVDAGSFSESGTTTIPTEQYSNAMQFSYTDIDLVSDVENDSVYAVKLSIDHTFVFSKDIYVRNYYLKFGDVTIFALNSPSNGSSASKTQEFIFDGTIYLKGSQLLNNSFTASMRFILPNSNASSERIPYESNLSYEVISVVPVQGDGLNQYESGYNAGYSDGLSVGQNEGYSNGYSDGYSEGESFGYDSGYQAGVDSVDTKSHYDAGYDAGYAAAYSIGYDDGYDSGYEDAMLRVKQWGADTNEYPLLIYEVLNEDQSVDFLAYNDGYANYMEVNDNNFYKYSYGADYFGSNYFINTYENLNPNHIYKIVLTDYYTELDGKGYFYIDIGSKSFKFAARSSTYKSDVFVYSNGYDLGSSISFRVEGIARYSNTSVSTNRVYFNKFMIYDYGPIGDTQNHIANQTDDLTLGYDSSAGESASKTFADNAASLDAAERSIFTSAKSSLDGYTFFDIESVPAVVSGLSFVSATMTSIFGAMGGASGAGIVLSVLFSVMIVSIVIGLYRYFVSSGKSGSGKGGRK